MKIVELSDADLVTKFAKGDAQAFEAIVRRHQSRLLSSCVLLCRDRYAAEDLVQETFLKAVVCIRAGRYNEEGKLLPWLLRMAHNLAIDKIRKSKRRPEIIVEDGSPVFSQMEFATSTAEDARMRTERDQQLRDHVKSLPESQREVLMLRHFAGMSFKEIAEHTDVSINTALGRMRYALINLRKKMNLNSELYDQNLYTQ